MSQGTVYEFLEKRPNKFFTAKEISDYTKESYKATIKSMRKISALSEIDVGMKKDIIEKNGVKYTVELRIIRLMKNVKNTR